MVSGQWSVSCNRNAVMAKPPEVLGVAAGGGRHGEPQYPAGVGCLQPGGKGKVCILENNKVVQQRIKFFSYNRNAVMAKPSKVLGVAARGGRHGVPQYPAGVGCLQPGGKGKVCILENNKVVFKYTNPR